MDLVQEAIQVTNIPKQGVPLTLLQDISRTVEADWNRKEKSTSGQEQDDTALARSAKFMQRRVLQVQMKFS